MILYTTLGETIAALKAMYELGYDAVPITSYVNADPENVPKLAGEAAVGLIAGGWVPVADPNDPDIQKFWEIVGTYVKDADGNPKIPNAYHTAGFIAAELLVKGLEDAGPRPDPRRGSSRRWRTSRTSTGSWPRASPTAQMSGRACSTST